MKNFLVILSFIFVCNIQAQQQPILQEDIKDMLSAYMDYFKDYTPLAPKPVRKAKFNKIVNKQNPNLSQVDRERAFKIVDAYIRADQGLDHGIEISDKDKQLIKNMLTEAERQKQTAMNAMLGEVNRYKQMSYSEYKAFVTQNGQVYLPEIEIQKAYNNLHKHDGKQVVVTKKSKKTKVQSQMEAIDILQHPKKYTYPEFRSAILFLKPNTEEEEIRKIWESKKE